MDHVFTTLSARCNNVVANFVDSCNPFVTMFVSTLWHAGNKVDRLIGLLCYHVVAAW